MNVHRLASSTMVRAPAKLNLFFEILARRGDGYHEIETLMVPIDLFDSLWAAAAEDGASEGSAAARISLDTNWAAPDGDLATLGPLPPPQDNLVTRAVRLLRERAGVTAGLRLRLVKRIPTAAGLGGGSSDAAAALLAANDVWQLGWSRERLAELGAELGSDVPFFFGNGPAICRGRGEQIEPVDGLGHLSFVLVRPPEGLPTAQVYARCRVAERPRAVQPLIAALRAGDTRRLGQLIHNGLEPAAASLSPWIGRLKQEMAAAGCLADQVSGSGSSYFGICRHARHARGVARRLRARGLGRVYAVGASC